MRAPPDQTFTVDAETDTVPADEVDLPAEAEDLCDGVVPVTNDAPAAFPKGTTTVTCSAVDAAGNEKTCTFTVTVREAAEGREFIRGDFNADGRVAMVDVVWECHYIVKGSNHPNDRPPWANPPCLDAGDANDDGKIDLCDPLHILRAVFCCHVLPEPFPDCGVDPTDDELGCESFPPCEDDPCDGHPGDGPPAHGNPCHENQGRGQGPPHGHLPPGLTDGEPDCDG